MAHFFCRGEGLRGELAFLRSKYQLVPHILMLQMLLARIILRLELVAYSLGQSLKH